MLKSWGSNGYQWVRSAGLSSGSSGIGTSHVRTAGALQYRAMSSSINASARATCLGFGSACPSCSYGEPLHHTLSPEHSRLQSFLGNNKRRGGVRSSSKLRSYGRSAGSPEDPHRIVFLGTPEAAAVVLRRLFLAAKASQKSSITSSGGSFEVSAVVTRPSRRKTHGKIYEGSPVSSLAMEFGMSENSVLSPKSAKSEDFLSAMRSLRPSLCVTAAYGNVLPQEFLDIPTFGTVNIHPSQLPNFRGPAPVQRAMMRGDRELCVSLAFTVLKMDAGRIASQKWLQLDKDETSDVALSKLFELGSDMLLENLPQLLNGTGYEASTEQDHTKATQAPKLSKQEGILQLHKMTATECHDIACALNVWPGTSVKFTCFTPITREIKKKEIDDGLHTSTGREFILKEECFTIKVSETSVEESLDEWDSDKVPLEVGKAQMYKGRKATDMLIVCKDNTLLRVGQMQLPGKKPIQPRAFFNGRKGAKLLAKEKEKKVIAPA